jgi:transketolase
MDKMNMRDVFVKAMIREAERDERLILIHADTMKVSGAVPMKQRFPERVLNVGIAEANMVGIAAGLSAWGKVPVVFTFTPFATRRCYDQIVVSISYARLNAKIVGTNPGVTSEANGGTHLSVEDVAIMRAIPGMTVVEAADGIQLDRMMPVILSHSGPVYLRLARIEATNIYDSAYEYALGKGDILTQGRDVSLIASGVMVTPALEAARLLGNSGIGARVLNLHTIKPIDRELVIKAARETKAIVTVENGSIIGGLGGVVAETLVETCPTLMKRIGIEDIFGEVGPLAYLYERFGLTVENIVSSAKELISRK